VNDFEEGAKLTPVSVEKTFNIKSSRSEK
jgi:hypothetical protein